MAITTLDLLIAGFKPPTWVTKLGAATVAGTWYSPFYVGGAPGAAAAPAPGIGGAALTTYAGQIPIAAPSGNTHLARFVGSTSQAAGGHLLLCDRLWHNSGISSTLITAQTVTSAAWPARSSDGTVNGADVLIGTEVSTVMGAGAGNATLVYTDQGGTGGNSTVMAYTATNAVGTFQIFPLLAGDSGVRAITSIQWSVSRTSGVIHLVAFRVLAALALTAQYSGFEADAVALGMPRLYDNTVPFLLYLPSGAAAPTLNAQVVYSQG